MTDSRRLQEGLSPCIELRFPNFERHYEISRSFGFKAYAFAPMDCRLWYREMVDRVWQALGVEYLPIYRMSDGEYTFVLGPSAGDRLPLWQRPPRKIVKNFVNALIGKSGHHRSGSMEYGYEEYTSDERTYIWSRFVESLQKVAKKGILALGLDEAPLSQPYVLPIVDWLQLNQIVCDRRNYYHFYSVYVLMHGPDRHRLLQGRHVLVVTGLTDAKRRGIEAGLYREGVTTVQFLPTSLDKAMLDDLDLNLVRRPVDIVLVGAGVGSVSVLAQMEPLKTVSIDVGFALSTLANPDLRWNRPYCVPDEEFDIGKVRWLPKEVGA